MVMKMKTRKLLRRFLISPKKLLRLEKWLTLSLPLVPLLFVFLLLNLWFLRVKLTVRTVYLCFLLVNRARARLLGATQ